MKDLENRNKLLRLKQGVSGEAQQIYSSMIKPMGFGLKSCISHHKRDYCIETGEDKNLSKDFSYINELEMPDRNNHQDVDINQI